ncbi:hypothetical protein QWZ00_13380 [Belliella kenyensis]|nr:hypothetical protein [Belliella kenyensis]MDN3604107.1 hypothetical protein [Belliella kenyensis]
MDVFEVLGKLQLKEVQIEKKIQSLIEANLDPFPMDRLQKGKVLLSLIREFKMHVDADDFIQAGMRLRDLELEGLHIK